jgi:Holliday junction resolvase RusA-like endonuclease
MSTCKIIIPFTPKAKGSWRLGKFGQYNPSCKGMLQIREYVKSLFKDKDLPLFSGPLLVIAHYRLPAPSSILGKKRLNQHCLPHIKRPDGDNLEKFLNDSLNGIIWQDDCRIAWLLRSKSVTRTKIGEMVLFVRELDEAQPDYELILADIMENIRIDEQAA